MTCKVGKAASELIHFARLDTQRALECLLSARGEIGWAGSIVRHDDVVTELACAREALSKANNAVAIAERVLVTGDKPPETE